MYRVSRLPIRLCSLTVLAMLLPRGGRGQGGPRGPLADLAPAALRIEGALLQDQTAAGSWATQYTSSSTFETAASEQNTFVPCIVASLLQSMPASRAVRAASQRAIAALADQRDAGGLVSYYGRPTVITPDADDTALVWTLAAGGAGSGQAAVVAALNAHRSANGLYRTWLADESSFVAVNTGRDANPTDIGIQLDVLVFLARSDPAAAARLFSALKGSMGSDSLWVYYRMTPLLPILRVADLARLGYVLEIPPDRRRARIDGQADWVRTCELIGRLDRSEAGPDLRTEAIGLLHRLAGDIPGHPPLFYHNDLSASVSRYYWSRDFGYALWLKLYTEMTAGPVPASGRKD